ncbi:MULTISPECIES: hypothetical protein [unclassified Streptomyces]|uniref:hypothetical protein n=1 Tax=unclassified Streptomyces TaxID=2593676 RepID=UPI00035F08AA|nr:MULTISPECIES: hypothetical protein [unclassified Streptomyces]
MSGGAETAWLEAEQVPELLREVALPRERLDEVALRTERPRTVEEHRDQIAVRLGIVEDSAREALEIGGGVLVR